MTTVDAALAALAAVRPELRGAAAAPLGRGLDHAAFRVGDLVLRLAAGHESAADGAGRDVGLNREAALLAVVRGRCPVAVPEPVASGAGWMAYPLLPGMPLLDRTADAPLDRTPAVATTLGRVLSALWATPRSAIDGLVDDDAAPLEEWRDEAGEHVAQLGSALADEVRAHAERWLRDPVPAPTPRRAFSHNDLGAEHVLVDEQGRVTGIIDWADAAVADPAKDLGLILRDLGTAGFDAAAHAIELRDDAGLADRARFYARCLALEDLAYGLETDQPRYVDNARAALERLLAAGSA